MIVEVRNVHHRNKGAELMLRAMVDHYAGRTDVTLVGSHRVGKPKQLKALGLKQLLYVHRNRGFHVPPTNLPPAGVRASLNLVHPTEVDVVLDAAGFAYGDQWGTDRAVLGTKYYRYMRKHGAKIVLMPMSLGPFTDPDVVRTARELFAQVDLVFPRDDTAAAAIRDLLGDDAKIHQAPDFTPLMKGTDGPALPPGDKPAAIIPNRKMVQKGGLTEREYVVFLAEVVRAFRALGYTPFALPHATFDHQLAEAVRTEAGGDLPILVEPDALKLKGVIGRCHAIFSSRFHGLVSGLCQEVPVIATGWSHKYRHLLDEYGCPEALVDAKEPGALQAAVDALLVEPHYAATKATLADRAAWAREQSRLMWARVDALVEGTGEGT